MKRRDIIKELRKIAKAKGETLELSEGGKHSFVTIGKLTTTLPRHNEVNELTAKGIIKYMKGE
ncbi:HicA-like toxin [Gordonia phage Santhid]|uniref:HicA-like toxin n=1 Tax=Gordonia phage Santhid TaxID=2927281 RepID=A0AAE9KE97_9CAUD|nr:HicA-like toxin [Gordonia phage Santhid]UOK18049.1 HicA-like toxin [Gordonia phage Santhid]